MAKETLNNGDAGSVIRAALNNMFTELYSKFQAATAVLDGYLKHEDFATFAGKQDALSAASADTDGYLKKEDWSTFNSKQDALSAATALADGYLKKEDWSTFNGKQDALTLKILAMEAGKTTNTDQNIAGLASAIDLCTEILTKYSDHVADITVGETPGEHKALHEAAQLVSEEAPIDLTTLLARVNDITAKYTLHDIDAASETPEFHQADVGEGNPLISSAEVTTLAGAITALNDIKAKFNLHDADTIGHTTGSKYQVSANNAALGDAIRISVSGVKVGDKITWAILDDSTANVTGVTAEAGEDFIDFTFSENPGDDAIISYLVASYEA